MTKNNILRIVVLFSIVITAVIVFRHVKAEEYKSDSTVVNVNAQFSTVSIPDSLNFAGENVPMEYFDVKENLDRELLINSYFHSQTIRFIKLAPRYFSVIEPILKEQGIPDDFKYLAVAESNLDPKAISPARAVGMWQFLKVTAREYGLEVNSEIDERYHIEKSTYAACKYLKSAYERFGSWALVAAAYNSGRTNTVKQMTRQKSKNYFDLLLGEETERYVFRILALKMVIEHPEVYGFNVSENEKYPIIATKDIEINAPVENFADFAIKHGTNYKILKLFNPWLRDSFLTNNTGKKYVIRVPKNNARDITNNSNNN